MEKELKQPSSNIFFAPLAYFQTDIRPSSPVDADEEVATILSRYAKSSKIRDVKRKAMRCFDIPQLGIVLLVEALKNNQRWTEFWIKKSNGYLGPYICDPRKPFREMIERCPDSPNPDNAPYKITVLCSS